MSTEQQTTEPEQTLAEYTGEVLRLLREKQAHTAGFTFLGEMNHLEVTVNRGADRNGADSIGISSFDAKADKTDTIAFSPNDTRRLILILQACLVGEA